ncbi:Pentatricopeptide repeat-containing protein [Vitis vinifera]|uniref:Pentatricopeptide repeat-containing protein n=1 Tax=Vitis vinifera TaxID=29760 RepID=A0A438FKV4_VITVI|nr:Pentatricopeptide repeat-containing protein [Vitis vinifera]
MENRINPIPSDSSFPLYVSLYLYSLSADPGDPSNPSFPMQHQDSELGRLGRVEEARRVFNEMIQRDVVSWNSMINGRIEEAREVFESMTERNVVSWNAMISGYVQNGDLKNARKLFDEMPEKMLHHGIRLSLELWRDLTSQYLCCSLSNYCLDDLELIGSLRPIAIKTGYEGDVVVGSAILNAYTRNGSLDLAMHFFETMPERNEYSWTTMIAAFAQCGRLDDAIQLYERVPEQTVATKTAMMTAYAQNEESREALELLIELHRSGSVPSDSSFTSALSACANIGDVEIGRVIHSLAIKTGCQFNSYVMNGLISMYAKCGNVEDGSHVFRTIRVKDTVSWNSLISGLSENYMLDDARVVFEKMPKRDVVSWTAIISAYVQAGHGEVALDLFLDMLARGIKPNQLTVTSLLSACGNLGWLLCVEEMPEHDLITWNAVLVGCAQNGLGKEAIKIFEQMEVEGILPDQMSFLGVLCACSHAGLVDEGWAHFNSMTQKYGIMPLVYHYTCMVDLLGRAGYLSEAEALIENMPVKPDSVIWEALLGACRIHRNVELGQRVAERLFQMTKPKSATYVLLSNLFASQGMWDKVAEIRKLMKDQGLTKEPGISWIQVKNKLHCFVTGDRTHDQIEEIYSALKEYYGCFRATGYMPDTNFVLHDVEEEQKQNELLYHSEKLAVVFGILSTPMDHPFRL